MSTNWDLLIENHFDNKKNDTLKVLSEAVREVMAEMPIKDDILLRNRPPLANHLV